MWIFKKDKDIKHWIKKIDAVVTWLILWGVVASVYGIKKYEDKKHQSELVKEDVTNDWNRMSKSSIIKALLFWFEKEKKKKSFLKKIISWGK